MNPRIQMQLLKMNMQLDTACFRRGITLDADYPKDPDPKNWRTIQGAHVHLSKGKIDGGAGGKFHGKQWNGKQWHQFTPSASKEYKPEEGKQFTEKYQSALNEISKIVEQSKKGKGKSSYYQKKIDNVEEKMKTLELFNEKYKGEKAEATAKKYSFFDLSGPDQLKMMGMLNAYHIGNEDVANKKAKELLIDKYGIPVEEFKPVIDKFKNGEINAHELKQALTEKILTANAKKATAEEPIGTPKFDALNISTQQQINGIISVSKTSGMEELLDTMIETSLENPYGIDADVVKFSLGKLNAGKISEQQFKEAIAQNIKNVKKSGGGFGKGFDAYDLSEKNIGWKLPKGTQLPFKDKYGDEFEAYDNQESDKIKQLDQKQQVAIWRYTSGSTHLRDWLVYGKTDPAFSDVGKSWKWKAAGLENPYKNGMTGPAIQKVADDISKGLKKIKHADIVVDRKCSLMDWATKDNPSGVTFKKLQEMAKSGEVFENKAFLSCSPVQGSTYGDGKAVRHIFVPKKAPGAYINGASAFDDEREFLLDKGSKTRIMKVEKDNNGKIHIYEEVVL